MVDPLHDAALERAADRDVVEEREMLHVLAQPDAAGVRADGNAELGRQQQDGDRLVDAADAARIELADVDRARLEELLEDHAVLDVLTGRHADGCDLAPDAGVPEHVVGARGLLDPPRLVHAQAAHRGDGLLDAPDLVRVHH